LIRPGIQLKPIESDATPADRDLRQIRARFGVEAVPIH
jgi:hypothetical protein